MHVRSAPATGPGGSQEGTLGGWPQCGPLPPTLLGQLANGDLRPEGVVAPDQAVEQGGDTSPKRLGTMGMSASSSAGGHLSTRRGEEGTTGPVLRGFRTRDQQGLYGRPRAGLPSAHPWPIPVPTWELQLLPALTAALVHQTLVTYYL